MALVVSVPAHSQVLQHLSVDFVMDTRGDSPQERIEGTIYYIAPDRTLIYVASPVVQWNVFDRNTLLIYYPVEQRAFRFVSRNRLLIPFSYSFLGFVKDDFGLSDAGFALEETGIRDGGFVSIWSPPLPVRSIIGGAVVGMRDDRPYFLELLSPDGRVSTRVEYADFYQSGIFLFPATAQTTRYQDDKLVEERYTYSSFSTNVPLPDSVLSFALPDGVTPKELSW